MTSTPSEMRPYAASEPMLIGLLVDVSGSMTSAIENKGASQNRLESFRDALEDFVLEYGKTIEQQSKDQAGKIKLFAYGFGFGNPLAQLLGRSGPVVRDLLLLSNQSSSTIDIVDLAKKWPQYKAHVEGLAPEMFGSTPMGQAFEIAKRRFASESPQLKAQQILFVLSDGEPSDSTPEEIARSADELKQSGTLIISCYVTSEDVAEPRHIYGSAPGHWSSGATLMFNCASVLPKNSPFEEYLREFQWKIDEEGRLFTQINQSELLSEFMKVILSPVKNDGLQKSPSPSSTPATEQPQVADQQKVPYQSTPSTNDKPRIADEQKLSAQPDRPEAPNWPAWIFGSLLVLFFMGVIWFKPREQFSADQQKLLRILAAVFVGVISGFFTGNLKLEGKIPALKDVQIGAIGGFAGFALTFFLW